MNQKKGPQIWILLGVLIGGAALAALLLFFLGQEPAAPPPVTAAPTDTPVAAQPTPDDPVVAQVNTETIRLSAWQEAVLLDQVMNGLAGQPAPVPEETLQRLVNEALVLQKLPPAQEPSQAAIEQQIVALEQSWGVEGAELTAALEAVNLSRADMERAVGRLLRVQGSLGAFESQEEVTSWLTEQRAAADITLFAENQAALTLPTPQAVAADPSPTAAPATPSPSPQPPVADVPEVAPDFTLQRANGENFNLSKQLEEGPVVLIFFQKCA
jgi:hypothetical protein